MFITRIPDQNQETNEANRAPKAGTDLNLQVENDVAALNLPGVKLVQRRSRHRKRRLENHPVVNFAWPQEKHSLTS